MLQVFVDTPNKMDSETDCTMFSKLQDNDSAVNKPSLKFSDLVTVEEAKALVKKSLSSDAKLVDYRVYPYSEEKLGHMGLYYSLEVVVQRLELNDKETSYFFVKAVKFPEKHQDFFDKEIPFLQTLEPFLMENFKGERWAPKLYLAKNNALIMEDLNTRGFTNRSIFLDEQSIKAALTSIARFHATSLLGEERNNGRPLKDIFPNILKESVFDPTNEIKCLYFTVGMDLAVAIAEKFGLDSTGIRKAGERVFDITKASKTQRNVVSHGDLWSNNFMFNDDDHCILIDFQLIRYAPVAQDVMQLLYLSTSREFRQQYERKSIEFYHQALVNTLRDNCFKGKVPTLGEVLQGAEEQRLPALVVAVLFHPAQLLDTKTGSFLNDPKNSKDFCFKDRRPLVFKHMAENEKYAKKMEDNVKELVELSMIIDKLPRVS